MDIKDVLLGVKSWSLNKFYTKEEVQRLVNSLVHFEVVSELPSVSSGDSNVLYLVGPIGDGSDKYEEWIFTGSEYVMIGDTSVDLGGYVTSDVLDSSLEEYMTSSETQVALSRKYEKPAAGIPASDLADGVIPTELPASDVSAWAKAPNKPEYSWNEINEKPENVSAFNNDAGYLTEHQSLAGKQDIIADLDEIRAGAALGASALQIHQDISGKANVGDSYTKEESDDKYLTAHQDISGKANVADLAAVATSGAYSDLSGVPTIPTNVSDLNNDAGYLTSHQSLAGYATESFVSEEIAKVIGGAPETLDTLKEIAEALEDTASMSALTEAIATKADATSVYTKVESDAKYLTEHQDISGKANVGDSYTKIESDEKYLTEHQDITGKANVGDSYTKAESDEKYLTAHQDISGKADSSDVYTKEEINSKLGKLNLDGDVEESSAYDYIYDEASWNESYANGVLKAYYEKYPSEDLWNETEHRAANFNDKAYEVNIYDNAECEGEPEVATMNALWVSGSAQKISDASNAYYLDMFYSLDNNAHELFSNKELTESTGKFAKFLSISYPSCTQCWEGVISNAGAKFPWIAPYFTEEDGDAKIIFQYEGKEDVKPWGETVFGSKKAWGIASIPTEFHDNGFLIPECVGNADPSYDGEAGANNFDIAKFKVILVKQEEASVKTYMENYVAGKEDKANKVTVLSTEATDEQYPSAKLLLEELAKTRNLLSFALGLIEDKVYDYIYDEASWNAAYNKKNSGLKAYLDRNPDEDRWNEHENRWAWAADKVDGEWPEWCVQCWKGAISADGAKYPWVVVNLPKPFVGTIKFSYEGKEDVYPWGEAIRTFANGYGIASIPTELGDEFLLDGEGNTTFDTSKFSVTIIQ